MIRINNHDYNGTAAYPNEKIIATITTDVDPQIVFADAMAAKKLYIVNDGVVQASYGVDFYGIEIYTGGFVITFSRTPMTEVEVQQMQQTLNTHTTEINKTNDDMVNVNDAIDDLFVMILEDGPMGGI